MIEKAFTPKRSVCKVTFKLPNEMAQRKVAIVGNFNNWDPSVNHLEKKSDAWQTTLRFKPDTEILFRYFIDDQKWVNEDMADGSVGNVYGSEDSILKLGH
ncbi:MAG: isoamylase early set domain-containing protein [Balneolales bacterium]